MSIVKFMIRECDDADQAATLSNMLKEARAYSAYIVRKHNASEPRISLCEMRDKGEALSFTDLVKICRFQQKRYNIMQRFCGRPNLSRKTKKLLNRMMLTEVEKLAVMSTLLKYPLRTSEAEKSKVKWTGNNTMRLLVPSSVRKGKKYPIDVKLSR